MHFLFLHLNSVFVPPLSSTGEVFDGVFVFSHWKPLIFPMFPAIPA